MSGGKFNYAQGRMQEMAETLEEVINRNGKPIPQEDWDSWEIKYYKDHPEEAFYETFSDEVIQRFKEGLDVLKRAYIYANEIDYLLSGDSGEDSFLASIKEELNN